MKKIPKKIRLLQKKRQIRLRLKEKREANIRRHTIIGRKRFLIVFKEEYTLVDARIEFRRNLYKGKYNEKPKTVVIEGDFGIEEPESRGYFFEKVSEIIDFNNREITIDIKSCTRVWPSAITMLCSLKQWVELSTLTSRKHRSNVPQIKSSDSENDGVNDYLRHSGFYGYVNRLSGQTKGDGYPDDKIVKIQRETKTSNIETREDQIIGLLRKCSTLDERQIALFECIVLIEVLNNVTEHGISHRDKGWWVLAQHHETHGYISLCIADNGIGIKNILITGPQKEDISKMLSNTNQQDHEYIDMALSEQVSGALHAPTKTKRTLLFEKKYARGEHRGNGLKRIRDACEQLKIPFSILSHHGYAFIDENGRITHKASLPNKVFAGTLHHFIIPAITKEQQDGNS